MMDAKRKPFPKGRYIFRDNANGVIEDGKIHFPSSMTVILDKREALAVIERLAYQLGFPERDAIRLELWGGDIEKIEE
jgi:hypothetical protein